MSEFLKPNINDFEVLLNESLSNTNLEEGSVVTGCVIAIEKDLAIIDVGLKTEGRVPLKEFQIAGEKNALSVGDKIEVYLERIENAMGEAMLSREKARREESWIKLEKASENGEKVNGIIFGRVKGGFTVDLDGAIAFLPGSQVDIRPIRDINPLMNILQPFQVLKMDKRRGNIVVSRRSILEEARAEQRADIVANLAEGQEMQGIIKNITDYGAFVDLGGIDGLLHVTDIAWKRINHPSEILTIGESIKVQIIKINPDTQRISLGMKQLQTDPWSKIEIKFPIGSRFSGTVTNITDYGAFVELNDGIEGLVHVSEMSWTKKNIHPGKIVATSQKVEVMVLEVDSSKRRISLGLKQCLDNPWIKFTETYAAGTEIQGEIKNITEFGLFIGLDGDVDGMVHLSDLDWNISGDEAIKKFKKNQTIKAIVLEVDIDKERISLGIKQLDQSLISYEKKSSLKRGKIVNCKVISISNDGLLVKINNSELTTTIRHNDLSYNRKNQRLDNFKIGDFLNARITQFDNRSNRISVSIKALEIAEEQEAVAKYASNNSGASLGDILGAALNKK